MRRYVAFLGLAVLLAAGLHLFRPNREAHAHAVSLGHGVSYAFNADSALFARSVLRFPQGLWDCEACKVRILCPLYPALGRALFLPLSLRGLLVAWGALVVLNLALTWLSGLLVFHALRRVFPEGVAFGWPSSPSSTST